MVNSGGGAMTVTLPITSDGKVNFSIMDTYSKVINKLKQLGAKVGTQDYERKKAEILKRVGLGYLVDASRGTVNPKYFVICFDFNIVNSRKLFNADSSFIFFIGKIPVIYASAKKDFDSSDLNNECKNCKY